MTTYLIRRVLLIIPTLFGITMLTFLLIRLAPGNAAMLKGSGESGAKAVTAEERQARIALYDLDKPWYVAYGHWLERLAVGNLGESVVDHRPVSQKMGERIGLTATLAGSAIALSYLIAIPLGIIGAIRRGQVIDRSISFVVFVLYSIPSFSAALVLILFVAGGDYLNLVPMSGVNSINASEMSMGRWALDRAWHLVLPIVCLTYGSLAGISRYARVSMLEALGQDFVRTARAKGLPERVVVVRHALRNALIPLITIITLELPALVGGTIIIEGIFSLPGMGYLIFQSLEARDTPVIMGCTVLVAVVTLTSYLLADILYVMVDPRISYE